MKEAILYEGLDSSKVGCKVCPRGCVVARDKVGYCGVRGNKDGRFYSLTYAKCSSVAADPIEKKPVFHFFPGSLALSLGTIGCNFKCKHCQNWQIAHADFESYEIGLTEVPPEKAISLAREYNCQGIAWTYNEPTIWLEYTIDSAKLCKEVGLYTVYVTNGYITFEALDAIGPFLDVFRVDIKGFTNEVYKKLAGVSDFTPILEATKRAKNKWNMHIEVVTNVIPTYNDDDRQLRSTAEWIKESLGESTPWHVTRFVPYLELSHLPPTPVETLEKARQIGRDVGLHFVYLGNVYAHPAENTYCPNCDKLVIERSGYSIGKYEVVEGKCKFCGKDLNIIEHSDEDEQNAD